MAGFTGYPKDERDRFKWIYLKACYGPNSPSYDDRNWFPPVPPDDFLDYQLTEAFEQRYQDWDYIEKIQSLQRKYGRGDI